MSSRTPEQAKQWLFEQGYTLTGWARANGFQYQNLYRVLSGESKMLYGESREIAKKLNIKVPE